MKRLIPSRVVLGVVTSRIHFQIIVRSSIVVHWLKKYVLMIVRSTIECEKQRRIGCMEIEYMQCLGYGCEYYGYDESDDECGCGSNE